MPPTMRMLDNLRNTGSLMDNSWRDLPPKVQPVSQVPLPKPILPMFPDPLPPKPIRPTFLEPWNRPIIGRPGFGNRW
jgi:hypothetical protein